MVLQPRVVPSMTAGPSVLIASSEVAPYAKTGGLGDVMCSLPGALSELGARVSLVMPAYRAVLKGDYPLEETGTSFSVPVSSRQEIASVLSLVSRDKVPVRLIRADRYFDREHIYGTPDGDYPDNAERFVFFCRAILEIMRRDPPQILHANDWQTALAITFLKQQPFLYPELASVKTVITVHNLGYQGIFWNLDWHLLNLDWSLFNPRDLEFYGRINFLKGGLVHADAITTVSPTYAEEIKTTDQGFRLEGVFRERSAVLFGILNGVDHRIWDPATDGLIARKYDASDLEGKRLCKSDLQQSLGLDSSEVMPVVGMVSRLSLQKGIDLVAEALDDILTLGCQVAIAGFGERDIQELLNRLPQRYPGRVGVHLGFSEDMAHKVIAGSDLLLMPSRYEPGGLAQLYGLKYGAIPVVRATGGLRDTVTEFRPESGAGNGFTFYSYEARRLVAAVARALKTYNQGGSQWSTLVKNAMSADFSWRHSAQGYLDVYRRVLAGQ